MIEFSELSKTLVHFLRNSLVAVLLPPEDSKIITEVFLRASKSGELKKFRESLSLFIKQFVVKASNFRHRAGDETSVLLGLTEEDREKLEDRAALADEALHVKERKLKL